MFENDQITSHSSEMFIDSLNLDFLLWLLVSKKVVSAAVVGCFFKIEINKSPQKNERLKEEKNENTMKDNFTKLKNE